MATRPPVRTAPASNAIWADPDRAYRAVSGRDARFDGRFIVAVRTTGIYCRPSCPALTPKRENVRFFATAGAAQTAGFRACRRCLPDAVPGTPEWDLRGDLAARTMRLISDGVIERDGVAGLAARLGYSERHVVRVLTEQLGAGPLAMARAHRAHAARLLIETTTLPLSDIAFAAGFASIRQFNDTVRAVYAGTPTELRRRGRTQVGGAGTLTLRLPYRPPLDASGLLRFLGNRAIAGVETVTEGEYARTMLLPHGAATARLLPSPGNTGRTRHVRATLRIEDLRDLGAAVTRLRRLFDLDADPAAVDEVLAADPALAPSVAAAPGIRVPGSVDGGEILLRAVLGQQVSVAAARTTLTAITEELGERLRTPDGELTTLFPTPAAIAEYGAEVLTGPRRRVDTVLRVGAALAAGDLDPHVGSDPERLRAQLEAIPGIGPWTAGYVLMRVLGAPDEFLDADLALRRGAEELTLPTEPAALREHARRWQPWRSYADMHLWRAATHRTTPTTRRTR